MGQDQIYELLLNKRLLEDNSYFTMKEIKKILGEDPSYNGSLYEQAIREDLKKLNRQGFLDVSAKGSIWNNWNQCFRLTDKEVKKFAERKNKDLSDLSQENVKSQASFISEKMSILAHKKGE